MADIPSTIPTSGPEPTTLPLPTSSQPMTTGTAPVSTNSQPWSILLIDSHHTSYVYIREIARGAQGSAQLCQRLDDNSLAVRKLGLFPVSAARAARRDRESRIADELRNLQNLPAPGAAPARDHRFARLFSDGDVRAPFPDGAFFRESWWRYYAGGGSLRGFLLFLNDHHDTLVFPCALVLNLIHQALEALQWMNAAHIFHLDAHSGNIFLEDEDDQLFGVVGDFGRSRLEPPLEEVFNSTAYRSSMPFREAQNLSSEPADYTINDPAHRLPLDFTRFVADIQNLDLITLQPDSDIRYQPMREAIGALAALIVQERINDQMGSATKGPETATSSESSESEKGSRSSSSTSSSSSSDASGPVPIPEGPRPARIDITEHIARLKAVEQQYLDAGGDAENQAALAAWRQRVAAGTRGPASFPTQGEAMAAAEDLLGGGLGPYAVVDVTNEDSIQAGVAELVARTGHPNNNNPNPVGEEVQLEERRVFREWFETVFVPSSEHQYVQKFAASMAGQPWEGVTFPVAASVPSGPSPEQMQAFREFLLTEILPVAELAVRHRQQMAR